MNIRKIKLEDSTQLFNWVNKTDSLSVKIENKNKVSLAEHERWFNERLDDKNTHIWIIENKSGIPLGQIRFQKKNTKYYDIDIYIIQSERKKGLASKALNKAMQISKPIFLRALVKKNNIRSYDFFLKNGFSLKFQDQSKWVLIRENI